MKTHYIKFTLLALVGLAVACSTDDNNIIATPDFAEITTGGGLPTPTFTSGSADFSNYVAIGNSLTAGFADGALYMKGQEVSMPNILATQFALAGGGTFSQPLMNDDLGGLLLGGNQITPNRFIFDPVNQVPFTIPGTPTTEVTNLVAGPHNNMGVPGAKSFHLVANGYGNVAGVQSGQANPFFARMASSPNASVLEDALAQSPTFFTLWVGSNDILAYALAGGSGEDHNETGNLDPASYGGSDITNANVFAQVLGGMLQALGQTGADGVLINLPNVTQIPFLNTVPYNPLDPTNPAFGPQIPTLNTVFGALNQVYAALGEPERSVVFSTTAASAVVIRDENLADISAQITGILNASPTFPTFVQQLGLPAQAAPLVAGLLGTTYGQTRQANEDDLLVLTSSSIIGTANEASVGALMAQGLSQELAVQFSVEGVTFPLTDNWVLTPEEQDKVVSATAAFNSTIEMMATQFDLGFLNFEVLLDEVATNGYNIGGNATITADFVTGGAFSLDGVHPSPRGFAATANEIIDVINTKYGSNLPKVNPIEFTGLYVN